MWRQYEKDIKALPAPSSNYDKQNGDSLPAIANFAYQAVHDNSKVRDLESRIKLSEQSNRVLLEEMMKLQQELKMTLHQNAELVSKEQHERRGVLQKIDAAENMYAKISMQLMRTEEKVNMEQTTLVALMNQSKEVERAVAGGEQRSLIKGEQVDRYMMRFRTEIGELKQMHEQVHSSMRAVGEDVKTLKHRLEMQNTEFMNENQDMKQKMKRLESDSMGAVETMLKKQEIQHRDGCENGASNLRQNLDNKLNEIQDSMNDVRRKTDVESSERRAADQQAQLNFEKVQVSVRELETKYKEISHKATLSLKEKESEFGAEKSKLLYKMTELSEEQNKKALQREMELRDDAHMKFLFLEKKLQEEQTTRLNMEKSIRTEMETILDSLKRHLSDELQNMHTVASASQTHGDEGLTKIHECLKLLEGEIEAGKKSFEEVLRAEILARQADNEKTTEACQELQKDVAKVMTSMEEALQGIRKETHKAVQEVRKELQESLDQCNQTDVNGLTEIQEKLTELSDHLSEVQEALNDRPPPSVPAAVLQPAPPADNSAQYRKLDRKIERSNKWQEGAEKTLNELANMMQPLNQQIANLREEIENLQENIELNKTNAAHQPPSNLGMASVNPAQPVATDGALEVKVNKMEEDISQLSCQFEKLEQTVDTLRNVLTQKIASEAETNEKFRETCASDIEKIVKYFMREQHHVFVKYQLGDAEVYRGDVVKDGENEAHSIRLGLLGINRWGIYEAYKMLKLKAAWFDVAAGKNKTKEDGESEAVKGEENGSEKGESGAEDDEKKDEEDEDDDESESEEEDESEEEESEEENESEDEKESDDEEAKEDGKESGEEEEKEDGKGSDDEKEDGSKSGEEEEKEDGKGSDDEKEDGNESGEEEEKEDGKESGKEEEKEDGKGNDEEKEDGKESGDDEEKEDGKEDGGEKESAKGKKGAKKDDGGKADGGDKGKESAKKSGRKAGNEPDNKKKKRK